MKSFWQGLFSLYFFICISSISFASVIIPFDDIGELTRESEAIVLVRALENYEAFDDGRIRFRTDFLVLDAIKGTLRKGASFFVEAYSYEEEKGLVQYSGDLTYEEGAEYLLFLKQNNFARWKPLALDFYSFQSIEKEDRRYLVPLQTGPEALTIPGRTVEPVYVYQQEIFLRQLKTVVENNLPWDNLYAKSDFQKSDFAVQLSIRAAPTICEGTGGGDADFRWNIFPAEQIRVRYDDEGDPDCSDVGSLINRAISEMEANYGGINLSSSASIDMSNNCALGRASSDIYSWIDGQADDNYIVIAFDDPCSEIPNGTGCGGTLGLGGPRISSPGHSFDGQTFGTISGGAVRINNGVGACYCSSDLLIWLLSHEITHTLGLGHISTTAGNANMNPSITSNNMGIFPPDIECINYLYPLIVTPVELSYFQGVQAKQSIDLSWGTATETNNDFFTIERSPNGEDFELLATVSGAGNSVNEIDYKYQDDSPYLGINYYRLSQTDFDGSGESFEVVIVDYQDDEKIRIAPNPIQDGYTRLSYKTEKERTIEIQIFELSGRAIRKFAFDLTKGINRFDLELTGLLPGIYYVQFQNALSSHSEKIMIL